MKEREEEGNETAGKDLKKEGDVGQGKRGESLLYRYRVPEY